MSDESPGPLAGEARGRLCRPYSRLGSDAGPDRLDAVRGAYRETVMSVPHFEADYDESYTENVTEEFGPELATALVTGDRFDPFCRRTLLEAVGEGSTRREPHLDALDAVTTDRQAAVHEQAHRLSVSMEMADLQRYCYRPLPVTCSVLSTVTALDERVERCQRTVERAMATCT